MNKIINPENAAQLNCLIESVVSLGADISEVTLLVPEGVELHFLSGQYLDLLIDERAYSFSIASPPEHERSVQLHIRHDKDNADANAIMDCLRAQEAAQESVLVELPKGSCVLTDAPSGPLLFVANSTGFAQIKSFLEHAFCQKWTNPMYFYWGAQSMDQLYHHQHMLEWQAQYDNLHYEPVIKNHLDFRGGYVQQAVLEDIPDLSGFTVYASGSPQMVYAVMDEFVEAGLKEEDMFSDVFSYAPRA